MMLSRLFLNPMNREVQRCLGDAHRLHQFVMLAFPEGDSSAARALHGVLHRLEVDPLVGRVVLYVQSREAPAWSALPQGALVDFGGELDNPAVRGVADAWQSLADGSTVAFRLRANPTRTIDTKTLEDGKRRNGRRVPLRGDDARVAWLARKGEQHGFSLVPGDDGAPHLRVTEEARSRGTREQRSLTFVGTCFDGHLRVVDAAKFREGLASGIGPAKAYGFGLLTIAPA